MNAKEPIGSVIKVAVMDDIKAEWKKMREKPLQERVQYFLSYYKWYVVAGIAVLAIIASVFVGGLLKKEPILSGVPGYGCTGVPK